MSPRRAALWFALLGGACAWTAHLLLAYLIAEFGCVAGKDEAARVGVMLPAWWLLGVSAATIAASGAAAWTGSRARARVHHDADRWMARTGFIMSALFTFMIAVQSVPIFFYLHRC